MTGTTFTQTPPPTASVVAAVAAPRPTPPSAAGDSGDAPRSRWWDDSRVIATLVSTIIHTLVLIVLALLSYASGEGDGQTLVMRTGDPDESLTWEASAVEEIGQDEALQSSETPVPVPLDHSTVSSIRSPLQQEAPPLVDSQLLAARSEQSSSATTPVMRLPSGGGLSGRTPEGRRELGRKYGATAESEQAVDLALEWLAVHQRADGSWSFNLELDPCNGRCSHGKKEGMETPTPSTAATGLALLAFLGAGHTDHRPGPYQETVRRGLYYLRGAAADADAGYDFQQGSMYGHGIALMALGEALSMMPEEQRRGSDLWELVSRGSNFTCVAQHSSGSWGYVPGSPGDTTVTGWQVFSLVATRRSKIPIHTDALPQAKAFLESTTGERRYWFGYKGPPGEPTTTAIGLALMLYLGESPYYTPFENALSDLAERGPMLDNIYHDYYGTLALHHSRHRDWDRWNRKLRDHLVATQATSGHERGSWHFDDRWGNVGGRLYTTAMCAMTLEIYYRYLPLYEAVDDFPL